MKVGVFTPRSLKPLHPRLIAYQSFFDSEKIEFTLHSFTDKTSNEFSIANWLSLWFFDWNAINRCKPFVHQYDVVLINDMKYLPLAAFAHRSGKKVIYETIDHNVYLRFYQLQSRFPFFKPFKNLVTSHFEKREKKYVDQFCDEVIVNSNALQQYLGKATVLFYNSPFENLDKLNNAENPLAIIYLGAFTRDKGALKSIELSQKLKLPLYIFGPINEVEILKMVQTKGIIYSPKLSIEDLKHRLKELLDRHFLIGISLIEPAHYSYEIQEANKDIDYLALGIPIIGNNRKPTADKIRAGCGWFIQDALLEQSIKNKEELKQRSMQCLKLYDSTYAGRHFKEKLANCWNRLTLPLLKK